MDLVQVEDDPQRFVARLPDLDQEVRRIFPLTRLLHVIRSREMGLVSPSLWEDPREDPTMWCMLDGYPHVPSKRQQALSAYLAPAWSQCWSLNPGSDTLLRAYSRVALDPKSNANTLRDQEGVTVTTTVRHLLSAAESWHGDGADCHFVVGRVEYLGDAEIGQRIVNACNGPQGPGFFRSVQGRADSLLWKRSYFEHEQEVRLLLIGRRRGDAAPQLKVRPVRIDPNVLFTSISFDPRLQSFEVREREAEVRAAGFVGEVRTDQSYQRVLWQLSMLQDWPDP